MTEDWRGGKAYGRGVARRHRVLPLIVLDDLAVMLVRASGPATRWGAEPWLLVPVDMGTQGDG